MYESDDYNQLAIIRKVIPEHPELFPGQLVLATRMALKPHSKVSPARHMFFLKHDMSVRFWAEGSYVLNYQNFLRYQPLNEFWCLVEKRRFREGNPAHYIADPKSEMFGSSPFRFESEGELFHYMSERDLSTEDYYVSHMKLWPKSVVKQLCQKVT